MVAERIVTGCQSDKDSVDSTENSFPERVTSQRDEDDP